MVASEADIWSAGNRAVVQVFEGTSGIDVKKVRSEQIEKAMAAMARLTWPRRKSSSQVTA